MTPPEPEKAHKRGEVVLVLFAHSDLRTAKTRPALIVQADDLETGLSQVIVAMVSGSTSAPVWPVIMESVVGDERTDGLLERIVIDPEICHGKPVVRSLSYPVETMLELLSSGMTIDDILADYEDLERDDLRAVLSFAAHLSRVKRIQQAGA